MDAAREPILTPRLRIGLGLLALGLGIMFFCGKVVPSPIASAIAGGIALATAGFVLVIVESLREPPPDAAGADASRPDRTGGGPPDS
jgi:hypothetical protein